MKPLSEKATQLARAEALSGSIVAKVAIAGEGEWPEAFVATARKAMEAKASA